MSKLEPAIGKPQIHHLCLGLSEFKDNGSSIQNFREVTSALAGKCRCDTVSDYGQRYRRNHRLRIAEGKTVFLQFDPLQEKDAVIRFELNPTALGADGMTIFRKILESMLLDEYQPATITAKVSEIDLVVPVINTRVRDLLFFDQHKRKSAVNYGSDGEPYMIRIGSPKSDLSFEVSDHREVRNKGTKDSQVLNGVLLTLKIIGQIWTPAEFLRSTNPFASLQIWYIPAAPSSSKLTWKLLIAACRHRGAAASLRLIENDKRRERYRQKLTNYHFTDWWNPDAIWTDVSAALRAIELFPENARLTYNPTHQKIRDFVSITENIDLCNNEMIEEEEDDIL